MWTLSRREFLKGMTGATLILSSLPVSVFNASKVYAQRPLKVGAYGGIFQEMFQKFIVDPFKEETGIDAELIPISNVADLLKMKQIVDQGQAPPVDVTIYSTQDLPKVVEFGIYEAFDPAEIPLGENLFPELKTVVDGKAVGHGIAAWYQGIDVLTSVLEERPFSYPTPSYAEIYWNPRFKNSIMISGDVRDSYLFWITAETFFGGQEVLGTEEGIQEVFQKLKEVAPQIKAVWINEVEGQRAIQQQEIKVLQMWNDVSIVMLKRGVPIQRVWPKEGWALDHGEWVVIKGTPKREEAAQFINYSLRADVQTSLSENLFTIPTVKNHQLTGEFAKQAFAEDIGGGIEKAFTVDWKATLLQHEELMERLWQEFLTLI